MGKDKPIPPGHREVRFITLCPKGRSRLHSQHSSLLSRKILMTVSKDVQEFRLLTPFSVTVPYWKHFGECTCNFSFAISTFPFRKRKSAENSVYIYWKKTNKQKMARNFFFPFIFNRCIFARQKRRRVTMPV